jgi:hypothetical protein
MSKKTTAAVFFALFLSFLASGSEAGFLRVPYDYPTITEACEAAQAGDTVGVYPGFYYENAHVGPGVTVMGVTEDSMLVQVRASSTDPPFLIYPAGDPVIIENMAIWGGHNWLVFNENPNLLVQRCYLNAIGESEEDFFWLIASETDFQLKNCMILFANQAPNPFMLGQPSHVLMEDCVVWGTGFGSWCVPAGSRFEFRNNTIDAGFGVNLQGGGSCTSTDWSLIVVNSIIRSGWCGDDVPDTLEWRYNDFFSGWTPDCGYQVGNFSADPLFCDEWSYDYRLQPDSPCLGAGENGEDVGARVGICWDPAGVGTQARGLAGLRLGPPRPNPTSGPVRLVWKAPSDTPVVFEVLDVRGRLVRRLMAPGTESQGVIVWDGRDARGSEVRGGIYFLRALTGRDQATRRIVVVR